MAFNTHETKTTDGGRVSLSGTPETRTRTIRATLTGADRSTKPIDLIDITPDSGPVIPLTATGHPDNPILLLQTIEFAYVEDSDMAYDFVLTYSMASGTIGPAFPSGFHRLRVRLTSEQTRLMVDLDGNAIGSPYFSKLYTVLLDANGNISSKLPLPATDPRWSEALHVVDQDGEVGTNVRGGRLSFDLVLAGQHPWNDAWIRDRFFVNDRSFFGFAAGTVQYIGCEMDEVPDPTTGLPGSPNKLFQGVLHYVAGALRVGLPDGTFTTLSLDERLDTEFSKAFIVEPQGQAGVLIETGESRRLPDTWAIRRVHERTNLSNMIPPEPP